MHAPAPSPRGTCRRDPVRGAAAAAAALLTGLSAASARAGDVDLPRHPSLSPDGREVAFSWRGDLWKAPTAGGHAVRLTSHPADEGRSAWSPDGRTIAFESDRSGSENVWLMAADGSGVRRLTHEDAPLTLAGWTGDGTGVVVSSRREADVHPEPRPFVVPAAGGPLRRLHGAFGREPAESPDGARLAFTRGGSSWSRRGYRGSDNRDLWVHERAGGTFTRLTRWEGNDGRAAWTDAGTLLYLSDRDDATVNLFRMRLAAGESGVEPVTRFRGTDVWDFAASRDGRTAVVLVWDRLHRIDLTQAGAAPQPIPLTAPDDEDGGVVFEEIGDDVSEAALSPDGKVMAVVAYGDVLVRNVEDRHPTRRVTDTAAREKDLAWSPDGTRLYFTSDRSGREQIHAATVARTRTDIREELEKANAPPRDAAKPADAPSGAPAETPAEVAKPEAGKSEAAKSEAGKSDDPKRSAAQRWHDAVTFVVEPVVVSEHHDREARPSPDGRRLALRRGLGDVVVVDLTTKAAQTLVSGWDSGIDFRWSPDGRRIAYSHDDADFNSDVWVVPSDGGAPAVNLSRHPANDRSPRWSADGKVLAFLSERKDGEADVWRVHLDRSLDAKTPAEIAEYYEQAAAAAKKRKPPAAPEAAKPAPTTETPEKAATTELDLADAWKRLVRVTTLRGDEGTLEVTPAGDTFVFRGRDGSAEGIYAVQWDGTNVRRLAPAGAVQHVSLSGDSVVLVAGNRAGTVGVSGGAVKTVEFALRARIDLRAQTDQRFRETSRIVGEQFYHPTMKGLDWPALTERYADLARRARTADEFDSVAASFLGELNASHLGVRSKRRDPPPSDPHGRIGVDTEPAEGGWRITSVLPYGPASLGILPLEPGDVVVAVEGVPFAPSDEFGPAFAGRVGRETVVRVRRRVLASDTNSLHPWRGEGAADREFDVLLTPVTAAAEQGLRYDAWTDRNERTVHELSGRRLGYLHIRSMDRTSLEDFERDLFAAAEGHDGLVIDVRNNGGGNTADLVLASILVRPHAYTVPRGGDPLVRDGYPRDRLFIQRYVRPTNLLCNEKSFSNAEILAHAFRTLERGTLVGQTTYGGVISTGGTSLPDGTFVRIPFRGWFLPDGTDMENHGARPHLLVPQTPESETSGTDEQLRAAVEDLMRRL